MTRNSDTRAFPNMSTDDFQFPVAQQNALISAGLHSTLMALFLFGIYTGLFLVALYIYIHKKNRTPSRDRIIIGNMTALYTSMALYILSNWLYTNVIFCKTGATRVDMFVESITGDRPPGERIFGVVAAFFVFMFADGLLVWRCFHACGQSLHKSLLPSALYVVETVLVISALVYNGLIDAKPGFETLQTDGIVNRLTAAALTSVAVTSLVSTVVICRQIWQRSALGSRSRRRYRTIINILIQSSALYTAITLLLAILNFTDTGNIANTFTIVLIEVYITAPAQIISGMAPTVMIVALVVSSSQEGPETSFAQLPPDLIDCASHVTGALTENAGAFLEMQQNGSMWVEEQVSEEIQEVHGNDHELENGAEARRKSLV
ncbi:hypothetical protein CPC08DRAFT_198185 [Agrocybe pediades]|nr:hypothetical protein CPC08DRAFT_198185 [Agrocybe pediades]